MTIIQDIEMNKIIKDYINGLSPVKLSEKYHKYSPYIIRCNLKKCGIFKNRFINDDIAKLISNDYQKWIIHISSI